MAATQLVCPHGHELVLLSGVKPQNYNGVPVCDMCDNTNLHLQRRSCYYGHCADCSFDLCDSCLAKWSDAARPARSVAADNAPSYDALLAQVQSLKLELKAEREHSCKLEELLQAEREARLAAEAARVEVQPSSAATAEANNATQGTSVAAESLTDRSLLLRKTTSTGSNVSEAMEHDCDNSACEDSDWVILKEEIDAA